MITSSPIIEPPHGHARLNLRCFGVRLILWQLVRASQAMIASGRNNLFAFFLQHPILN
jgi:hypothetical protein